MRVGEKYLTNQKYWVSIIDYVNSKNCTIRFDDGTILTNKKYHDVKNGNIKHLLHPTVCGSGYLGYGKYKAYDKGRLTKSYTVWDSMILRCFSKKYNKKHNSYKGISVSTDWLCFQNFAKWFEENWKLHMNGWQLDKDILCKGCKTYSPETCCFVPTEVNKLFVNTLNSQKKVFTHRSKYR